MNDATAIDAATRRLTQALDALDASAERRLEADREGALVADQLHALGVDRSRLASELDAQTARAKRLETASREVAQRIDTAMQTVRAVLDGRNTSGE